MSAHLERACELLWQHGHPAIAEALQREVTAAEAALAEAQRELSWEREVVVIDLSERLDAARKALEQYADPRNWGIERDFRYPRAVWIGPGADQSVPDALGIARAALAADAADTGPNLDDFYPEDGQVPPWQTKAAPAADVDWDDPLSYVREMYGVPAEIGRKVLFNGEPAEITGGEGQYLWIVRGEEREPMLVHPTWHMDYLVPAVSDGAAPAAAEEE